ncbi:MAG: hypothetical protein ACLUSP_02695 [Christensenellales bacterium]
MDYAPERGAEFYGLTVKLTDIYDESNVVTIISTAEVRIPI